MEGVMDIAYGTGATIPSGKMVSRYKLKIRTQVERRYHCDKAGQIAMLAPHVVRIVCYTSTDTGRLGPCYPALRGSV